MAATALTVSTPKRNHKPTQQQLDKESAALSTMPLPTFTFSQSKPTSPVASDVTYNANAGDAGTSLRRFRTPAPHDVLSGRGGSVNAHPGNCQFRDWVSVRKEDYNLARTKQAKADICRQVIAKVEALGGRFLTKETPNSPWWIEQDDERIMAKTSQALREGAPKIREAHKEELGLTGNFSRRKPRNASSHTTTTTSSSVPPFSSSSKRTLEAAKSSSRAVNTDHNRKRVRVDYKGHMVLTNEDTPPLRSVEPPPDDQNLQDFQLMPAPAKPEFPPPLSRARLAGMPNAATLTRSHSLAISDIIADESYEFVNPFDDESDLFASTGSFSSSTRNSFTLGSPRPGFLRETSVSSTNSDFAGFGALIRGPTDANHQKNTSAAVMTTPDAMYSDSHHTSKAHIVDNEDADNCSVASESTLGLPLWDWFNRDDQIPQTHPIPISLQ
jgi:hypothetical protein